MSCIIFVYGILWINKTKLCINLRKTKALSFYSFESFEYYKSFDRELK